jgi:POLQ-like helicase
MIGDGERGAALEHLLSKVLYLSPTTQIVGMSATIGNLPQVGRWLRATTYTTDFRPVPLRQMVRTTPLHAYRASYGRGVACAH